MRQMQMYHVETVRMIPGPRHATANGVGASAATYGSGLATTGLGIVNIHSPPCDYVVFKIFKNVGTAAKTSWKIGYQSGKTALFSATCGTTVITSFLACGITASRTSHAYVLDVNRLPENMKYLNAKLITCTTCGSTQIWAEKWNLETTPAKGTSIAGITTTRTF